MMNEQALHQIRRKAQELSLLILSAGTGRPKGFDFDQFEIELVYHRGGLERVIRALGPHARGGNSPELGVEKLHQPPGSLRVAFAEARHEPGYRIGLKSGCGRQFGSKFNPAREKIKVTIQSARPLSH